MIQMVNNLQLQHNRQVFDLFNYSIKIVLMAEFEVLNMLRSYLTLN